MSRPSRLDDPELRARIEQLSGRPLDGPATIYRDTTAFMEIERGHVVELDGVRFLVLTNEHELRFGMSDQPKFWVKRTIRLDNGRKYVLKLVIREEFKTRLGTIEMRCYRSEAKEARVLELVRGDERFMQGEARRDESGNLVRVLEFIRGDDLLNHLFSLAMPHERYFHERFPAILASTTASFRAIQRLHAAGVPHGDVRTDHILVERDTGTYRWIDFDLCQDFSDYDLWSLGNVLHSVIGKGLVTFREVLAERPELSARLHGDHGALFFPHRIMNLREVFPYVPQKLNDILMRFSIGTTDVYETVEQVADDLEECAAAEGWPVLPAPPVGPPLTGGPGCGPAEPPADQDGGCRSSEPPAAPSHGEFEC